MYKSIISPEEIHKLAVSKGWYDGADASNPDFIPSKLCLIHSEVSEALEAYRRADTFLSLEIGEGSFAEELADVVIRVFDLCGFLGIDIEYYIKEKHEYNKTREYRHGNKVV